MRILLIAVLALLISAPAKAEWHVAESDRFVIYADDSEKDIQKFGEMLERFHSAMEYILRRNVAKPSPSNRVTIYAVGDQKDIQQLAGRKQVAGFYIPRAGGSVAFVQNTNPTTRDIDFSTTVLLHEYAHHFLISSSRHAMPRWMSEGAAEFYASAKFPKDGSVSIGRPAQHRAAELFLSRDVSIRELLDYDLYRKKRTKRHDAYYGRAWLFYHYMFFNRERSGQMTDFWQSVADGDDPIKAGEAVFGDLDALEKELDQYLMKRRITSITLKPEWLSPGAVTVRKLSRGHSEMMPLIIRSKRGVDREEALELLPEVRDVAAKFPDDSAVLSALAEAEHDAGNYDTAIAAADRALAINPADKNALVQKGFAMFRLADEADDRESAFKNAMTPFASLNKLENDHPLPLIYYHRSFTMRGAEPTELARHGIERAAQLAPFDLSLWMNVGIMQAEEGKIGSARYSLAPVAGNPHGGSSADLAAALLRALADAEEGTPFDTSETLRKAAIDSQVGGISSE